MLICDRGRGIYISSGLKVVFYSSCLKVIFDGVFYVSRGLYVILDGVMYSFPHAWLLLTLAFTVVVA